MIEARGLVKRYGPTTAVDNLSFDVRPGTVRIDGQDYLGVLAIT